MLPARKTAAFNFLLRRVLARTLRRRFHGVFIAGREHFDALDPGRPVIGAVNHSNWWDGFVLYVLSDRALPGRDIFLAMEEQNLRRYPFFQRMGCFGVDLENPRAALPGVRYALRLLAGNPGRLLWIFVQGELRPAHVPVRAKPGALLLARRAGAQVLPLVIRYEWLIESRPSILVRVGAPFVPGEGATPEALAGTLDALLARVGDALDPPDLREYVPLFPPRISLNKRWDLLRHRLRRGREPFDRQNR